MMEMRFWSKAELAIRFGISRETLRLRLKEIEGLDTGRRQLLYPYEVRIVFKAFGVEEYD
ncbi:hypothetical protein [Aquimarina algiphila]|uniref:HTH domain-containing protein n=1 Tax=Aquimarina algiphila TaxID=2047982 RepID=A0A554VAA7_9FLAO|nr:hypothetical protein [Aquimarina algiphila]TSE02764.1 hypothetical protein FOF46_30510 [Aquimarina algiphila]